MELPATIIIMILSAAAAGWAIWRARKPYIPGSQPLIPYGAVMFIGILVFILLAAHLITLLTGTPFTGRRRF